jgi:hypothetical protein
MTPPPRLADSGTEFERSLLASARRDVGCHDGLKRTLAAIGVGAATAPASTAAAGVVASGPVAPGGTALLASAGVGAFAKWVVVAVVVGGGAALSGASFFHQPSAPTALTVPPPAEAQSATPRSAGAPVLASPQTAAFTVSPPPALTSAAPTPRVNAGGPLYPTTVRSTPPATLYGLSVSSVAPAAPQDFPASSVVPAPNPAPVAAPPSAPSTLPIPIRSPSSLDAEVAMLDRVRASLATRDAVRALKELDAYDHASPGSALADEATVLRIDALMAHGDRTTAAMLGRRFLTAHPASPHAPHLLQLLGGTHNP